MRAHPQEQRLFILLHRFIVEESQRPAGIQPVVIQQAAFTVDYAGENKLETGTRRERSLFTGEKLQPAGTNVPFAEQHQANTLFGAKQGLMQPLDQAFRRPGA